MTKQEAIRLFGSQTKLANALGVTTQAISQWPAVLTVAQEDRVTGAAVRMEVFAAPTETGKAA